MNNFTNGAVSYSGVPYEDINWYDIVGQPFGIASYFNAIILGDANNIVDTKGAMAVGGNFASSRGLSLAFGNNGKLRGTGYTPDFVRFLVGGNVAMQGPLVVNGHVVAGGSFRAANGSTYMIGKDGSNNQVQELTSLYQANGGSQYWRLSDRGTHYAVSSYDVPRYIPAERIGADLSQFFGDAQESITNFHDCLARLQPNGTVTEHYHEWILRGNDPAQNVFLIDVRPDGILNKEIRFEIPERSLAIVLLRTGNNAHMQYGLWGDERLAARTLYVFEDASDIYMDVPAAIWGSILAPQAVYHAHQTGGTVNGNAALRSFTVNAASGFEFHLYPFIGGVSCQVTAPEAPAEIPAPQPAPAPAPIPRPAPQPIPIPRPVPPQVSPAPSQPAPQPVPVPQPVPRPVPQPIPVPQPAPRPAPQPIPVPQPVPRPTPRPIPVPQPAPAPSCPACPVPAPCPPCPPAEERIMFQPIPIPVPVELPCPKQAPCEECLITPGIIYGCIWGCCCGCNHDWEVKLIKICNDGKELIDCIRVSCCGCFQFEVRYDGCYLLSICAVTHSKKSKACKPMLTLKNVGVTNLMLDF